MTEDQRSGFSMEKAAIKAGAAYYCPVTGKFTFGVNGPTAAD